MKWIVSKSIDKNWMKARKRDKKKLFRYFENLYPSDYAAALVAASRNKIKA